MIGLPSDIIPDVLEYFTPTYTSRLCDLALVNSAWTRPVQRCMYRYIRVSNTEMWIRLLAHLELHHHLRCFVKELSLYQYGYIDISLSRYIDVIFARDGSVRYSLIPELLPCVEELSVGFKCLPLVPLLPALVKLELQDCGEWVFAIGKSPFDAALWPSTIRSVRVSQWHQPPSMLEWLDANPAVHPIVTVGVTGLPSDLPRFCNFLEEHPTIEDWGVTITLHERVVYGPVFNHVFRGHYVRTLSLGVLSRPHSDMLNLPFGLLRACEFPALRSLQLLFNLHDSTILDLYGDDDMLCDLVLDPFDGADDPTDDERWILPKGMALALKDVHIGFVEVGDVHGLDRLVGLLGAAFRPGVVHVEMSDKYLDRRRTFELCTASMDPGRDYLANH